MSDFETEPEKLYWYNVRTGQVEHGPVSPGADRAGPFQTAAEAERAPELLKERSAAWAEEDAEEDDWPHTS